MEKRLLLKKYSFNENIGIISNESSDIGSGHVSRCLNLISQIKNNKRSFYFFSSSRIDLKKTKKIKNILIDRNIISTKHNNKLYLKYKLNIIKYNIQYLIIDSYQINIALEKKLRKLVKVLIIFDDYYWRKHNCDVLINNNFLNSYQKKYIKKLHPNTKLLIGEKYLLLNKFFYKNKLKVRLRKKFRKIFIFFGNSEPNSETFKLLKILKKFSNIKINCIIGKYSKDKNRIITLCKNKKNIKYYYDISNQKVLKLIINSDLAIASGGVNLLERLFLGLPSIVITTADNQVNAAINLSKKKKILYLGDCKNFEIQNNKTKLKYIFKDKNTLKLVSLNSYKMFNKKNFFKLSEEFNKVIKKVT